MTDIYKQSAGIPRLLVLRVTMLLGVGLVPEGLFIVFALMVSLWMVAMGVLMWCRAAPRDKAHEAN